MHLRKLILVCGFFCSALLSQAVAALGLGEIQLNSKLNEPLSAEILLLDTQGLNSDQIIVGLASPADFERNGVDRIFFLTEFQFEVLLNRAGGPVVRVTSRNPVREPFLNFLIEARWPTGRLLREYTLLMDLPTFSETRANAAVTAPAAQRQAAPAPQAAPSRPSTAPAATRPSTRAPAAASGAASDGSYAVGDRDTLWQIALQVRPDRSHSVHQTMLAIQRLNPDAFIDGNINLLRKGQVLRIPSSDEIQALSQREAVNEVARQNQAWSNDSMGAQLSATRRETAARRDTGTVSGSVKLATPQSVESSSGQGSGDNTGRGRALESQLATSLEELDRVTGENQELSSRVRDLEEQIRTMERLVEVSNAQLRALQLKAAQDDDAATDTTADTAFEPYVSEQGLESSLADTTVEEAAEVIEEPVAPAETVAPAPVRTVVPPPAAPSLIDTLKDYLLLIVAAIGILVLLVAFVIYRRRQQAEQQDLENDDIFAMDADVADDEVYEEEESFFSEDAADETDLETDELSAEAETGDVVGEADIYIAYGKFDQAEEMLLNALAKDPDSIDIRLKLLEVYSQTQDAQKFDRYYTGLIGLAGQPALARAAELRDHIEGADEFVPVEVSGIDLAATDEALDLVEAEPIDGEEAGAFDDEFLLDDDLDLGASDEASSLAGDEDEADSFLLDDESLSLADDIKTGDSKYDLSFNETAPEAETERDDFTFDFDLEDESDTGTEATTAAVAFEEPELKSNDRADDDFAFEFDLPEQDQASPENEAAGEQAVASGESEEDDFDFNFEEDNATPSHVAEDEFSVETVPAQEAAVEVSDEELQLPEDADDFNLDMDMDDLDLAALDEEMKDLEADFAGADFELEENPDENAVVSLSSDAADGFEVVDSTTANEFTQNRELEEELTFIVEADATNELEGAIEPLEQETEITFDAEMDHLELSDLDIETATDVPVIDDRIDEDGVFEEALAGFDNEDADLGQASDEDMDAELDFLADADEAATKLDLARAYIDMGDTEGARDILTEVTQEGNEQQRQEAEDLLSRIDA